MTPTQEIKAGASNAAMDKAEAWLWVWGDGWAGPVKQSFTE